jgi:hypothetical protein
MAYTPTNWVEGVTTLGPTNMNKIETELAALDGRVPAAATAWTALTFQNTWTDVGAPYQTARYMKTVSGLVIVQGFVKRTGGAPGAGDTLTALPAGFRPNATQAFTCNMSAGVGNFTVTSGGAVQFNDCTAGAAPQTYTVLNAIIFPAEA